jgi:alkylation response protein AidB-like acyl-CoA dehydrogenase
MAELKKGCSFLFEQVGSSEFFTIEDIPEDQRMFAKTAEDFIRKSVLPVEEELEKKKGEVAVPLLKKAGEVGLLMSDIPEQYGGLGLDKAVSALVTEKLSFNASFSVTFGAHTGIGTLPIVFYGNEEQKKKYLPKLATAEWIGAYALTEPGAGSDALNIKTTAKLSPDGKYYILNGTKQFITNAGFADVIVTYAKIDGDKFTAFIIEKNFPGVSIGPEEKKMGLKGSSTCPVILEDARVPVENVLGEIGKGHYIAFNILNMGRFKLGVACYGGAKEIINQIVNYGLDRKQFNTPIIEFSALKQKLADMTILAYVGESMVYRTAGMIDAAIHTIDPNDPDYIKKVPKMIEEYAVEASIMKVAGSEALGVILDEAVQFLGGYGFIEEYKVEKAYRDARVNRIFEGTNEINRLLIQAMIGKRAMKGQIPLMEVVQKIREELEKGERPVVKNGTLKSEMEATELAKKVVLYVSNEAVMKYMGPELEKQEQVLLKLSNMIIDIYGMDSVLGRVLKRIKAVGEEKMKTEIDIARTFVAEACDRIMNESKRVLANLYQGDELKAQLNKLSKWDLFLGFDTMRAKERIADRVKEDRGWKLSI